MYMLENGNKKCSGCITNEFIIRKVLYSILEKYERSMYCNKSGGKYSLYLVWVSILSMEHFQLIENLKFFI